MGGISFPHYPNLFQTCRVQPKPFCIPGTKISSSAFMHFIHSGDPRFLWFPDDQSPLHQLGTSCSVRKAEKALVWGKKCRGKEPQQKISCLISKMSNRNKGHIYSCSLLFPCCYFSAQVVHLQLLSNILVSHVLHPSAQGKKRKKKKHPAGAKLCWQVRSINFFLSCLPFLPCSMSFTLH